MEKRGVVKQYFVMAELLFVGIVVLGMILFSKGVSEGQDLEKNYLARDIGLILTTIYASPGDVRYTYYLEKNEFEIEISKGQVKVSENGLRPVTYSYAEDETMQNPTAKLQKPNQLTFVKKGKEITVES